jgi:hypothetical protein
VERIGGGCAVRRWVRQRPDDLEELDDRARPTVRDDERQSIDMRRADVEEMDAEPVDLCLFVSIALRTMRRGHE